MLEMSLANIKEKELFKLLLLIICKSLDRCHSTWLESNESKVKDLILNLRNKNKHFFFYLSMVDFILELVNCVIG